MRWTHVATVPSRVTPPIPGGGTRGTCCRAHVGAFSFFKSWFLIVASVQCRGSIIVASTPSPHQHTTPPQTSHPIGPRPRTAPAPPPAIFPSIFLTDARFWGNPSPDCRGLHCYRSCLLSLYSNPYANFPKNCQDPIPLNTDMTHDSRSPLRRWLGQYSDPDPGNYKGLDHLSALDNVTTLPKISQ